MTAPTIPRLNLAHLPTPIEPLPRLSALLGDPRLFIKRDDQTGLALGGNKTRKLEFLVAEAQAQGARTLVTAGAWQSNHCRQTAAAAAHCGMDCILVLTGERQADASGNLLLDHLLGARIVATPDRRDRDRLLEETVENAAAQGQAPYLVPYGGSSPTGALGYTFAMQEVLGQGIEVDWMVFASSSGGTQAGLVLGQRVFGYRGILLGIGIDEPASALKSHVAALASDASAALGPRIAFDAADVHVDDRYCGPGYGVLTDLEREAIRVFARTEGILLDPVYTGRAAGGLLDLIRRGFFPRDARILFWHTGGQPALFAEPYLSALSETLGLPGADAA
ncbi:MAG: D-cysteine desulfhydrase family protein [Sphingobacteriia bacterium]|nr:D-cysteine desulfhydrase family protein [Sphingobacteriia bacterium]